MTRAAIIIAVIAVGAFLISYIWKNEHREGALQIYVFNLKSGRSILIRTPDDKRILVDGGGNSEIVRTVTSILPFYSRRLDWVISTSEEGKNISGLIDILDRFKVGNTVIPHMDLNMSGVSSSTDQVYKYFLNHPKVKDSVRVKEGDVLEISKDVRIRILFPTASSEFLYSKASAPQIVFALEYGNHSFFFLGDSSRKIQEYVAKRLGEEGWQASRDAVIVVSHSAAPDNMSSSLIQNIGVKYLVFAKQITKQPVGKKKKDSKTERADPLAGVLEENRFNVRQGLGVKIIMSDHVEITSI